MTNVQPRSGSRSGNAGSSVRLTTLQIFTRPNPVKPGQKPGLHPPLTGSGPGLPTRRAAVFSAGFDLDFDMLVRHGNLNECGVRSENREWIDQD